MNVIFLDHYGVMCLSKEEIVRTKTSIPTSNELINTKPFNDFDPKCVGILNSIIENTNIEIVVSSDWTSTIDQISMFYKEQGVIKTPVGYTPKLEFRNIHTNRSKEILSWVDKNKINKWIAIDDIYLGKLIDNFIWCDLVHKGISKNGIDESIISFFNE